MTQSNTTGEDRTNQTRYKTDKQKSKNSEISFVPLEQSNEEKKKINTCKHALIASPRCKEEWTKHFKVLYYLSLRSIMKARYPFHASLNKPSRV